jgi:pimeloyl-ACP methyl ester carboxylesterase
MELLQDSFDLFAVDLRGQGRSTRTPGRYTWDNIGNDLVRFIDLAIGRPAFVAGLSSGGVLSAWLSAYAKPGQIRAAYYEDPPLFASETRPAVGQSIRQGMGPVFALWAKYLGNQWSIGDWAGMVAARPSELPGHLTGRTPIGRPPSAEEGPPQNMREYDPEWGAACWTGSISAGCDHDTMLKGVRCPVLFTHHSRRITPDGYLLGAISDVQAARVRTLVEAAGQPFTFMDFPEMPHSMHGADPSQYARIVKEWFATIPPG